MPNHRFNPRDTQHYQFKATQRACCMEMDDTILLSELVQSSKALDKPFLRRYMVYPPAQRLDLAVEKFFSLCVCHEIKLYFLAVYVPVVIHDDSFYTAVLEYACYLQYAYQSTAPRHQRLIIRLEL